MDEEPKAAVPGSDEELADRIAREARKIGHDLNNCLGIVGGRAELMQMYLDRGNTEGIRKGVEAILGQMARMKDLSDALRELRRRA